MKLKTLKSRLKGFANIRNSTSNRTGKEVPNQFIISFDNGEVFKSYNSIIAVKYKGKVYLTDDWDYSTTTGKYRNKFLGEGVQETRQKIKQGIYKITT